MVAIFAGLIWYVFSASGGEGNKSFVDILSSIKLEYLALAMLCYFGINVLFTFRLKRVLAREGITSAWGKTLLAQYAGMLSSDVTPARSGYMLMPIYLKDQNIPAPASLSGILGIQSIEFLVKVIGGTLAIFFLVQTVPPSSMTQEILILAVVGIGLMLFGAILLILMSTSQRAIAIIQRIAGHRLIARFTRGLLGKLEEYSGNAKKTKKAIPEISALTFACWILKGLEWYFLALALGMTLGLSPVITYLGFFLIHPLVTALGFAPTPGGLGAQEWGVVIVLQLFGVEPLTAFSFALLARGLLIIEDLIGVPQIVKTSSLLFSKKTKEETAQVQPPVS
jgi:glycosyltransferase 2 family protein